MNRIKLRGLKGIFILLFLLINSSTFIEAQAPRPGSGCSPDDCPCICGPGFEICYGWMCNCGPCGPSCDGCSCTPPGCPAGYRTTPTSCASIVTSCVRRDSCGDACGGNTTRTCWPIGTGCDCTLPACPAGSSTVQAGPLCPAISTTSCTTKTSCGVACGTGTKTVSCFPTEKNTVITAPTNIQLVVDGNGISGGTTYTLSTNVSTPTLIKYPLPTATAATVKGQLPTVAKPATSRELGYYIQADNYGVNNQWLGGTACSGISGEDFCKETTSNILDFQPVTRTVLDVLRQGAKGQITGKYYTLNQCDNNKKYSAEITGYYVVDTLPSINTTDTAISNGEVLDATTSGCQATDYTGIDANNPFTINIVGSDSDGNASIAGAVLWFSKGATIPKELPIGPYASTSTSEVGILAMRDGRIYATNESSSSWGLTTGGIIKDSTGIAFASATLDSVSTLGTQLSFNIKVTFNKIASVSGKYSVNIGLVDNPMLSATNKVDQQTVTYLRDWYFDLVEPSVTLNENKVSSLTNLILSWQTTENQSSIKSTVVNVYRRSGVITDQLTMINPNLGSLFPPPVPTNSDVIGNLVDSSGWKITSGVQPNSVEVNVGNNEKGYLDFYTTVYDIACNKKTSAYSGVNLDPWISAKGGIVYSKGRIAYSARNVDSMDSSRYILNGLPTTKTQSYTEFDLGSETISSASLILNDLVHSSSGATKVIEVTDLNSSRTDLFNKLKRRLEERVAKFIPIENINGCQLGETCVMNPGADSTNIEITNLSCKGKTLYVSEGNITITPDLTVETPLSGCIFLAKENIVIKQGTAKSTDSIVGYDYLEGYLIAGKNIIIEDENNNDAVEIKGGAVALGEGITTTAFNITRDLKLFNITNPVLVITHDPKYMRLSELFFGTETVMYKQEVGLKSY